VPFEESDHGAKTNIGGVDGLLETRSATVPAAESA
jgi:hypothetical protein